MSLAMIKFSDKKPVKWEMALFEEQFKKIEKIYHGKSRTT
jgi:hypothetical protein